MAKESRSCWFLAGLIVLLAVLYGRTLNFEPVWDTRMFLQESVLLNSDQPLRRAFTTGYIYGQMGMDRQSFYYRPVVNFSFMLENRLWGSSVPAMRAANLLLFISLVILLFLFLRGEGVAPGAALTAVSLFALMPVHVDHVVWIVGRGDLLMAFCGVWSLLCIRRAADSSRFFWLFMGLCGYTLGQFSKETFLFFWPVLLFFEWSVRRRPTRWFHLSTLAVTLSFFAVKHLVLNLETLQLLTSTDLLSYPRTGLAVLGYYVRVMAAPVFFAPFTFVHDLLRWPFWLMGAAGIALFAALWRFFSQRSRPKLPLVLIAVFLIPPLLLAFSSIWPFRISARYLMVPLIGVAWIWATIWNRWNHRLRYAVVGVAVLLFASQVLALSSAYRSDLRYWEQALTHHPDSSFVLMKAAAARQERGDAWLARRYIEAALKQPMARTTAIALSMLSARDAYHAARYERALKWLDHIPFKLSPYERFHVSLLRVKIDLSRGRNVRAERALKNLISRFPQRAEPVRLLHGLYIGAHRWVDAQRLEQSASGFSGNALIADSRLLSRRLQRMSMPDKVKVYSRVLNYTRALAELCGREHSGDAVLFPCLELMHRAGREQEAQDRLEAWLTSVGRSPQTLNRIAGFYLKTMSREEAALRFYRSSLSLDPEQPAIRRLVKLLGG